MTESLKETVAGRFRCERKVAPTLHIGRNNPCRMLASGESEEVSHSPTVGAAGRLRHRLVDEGRGRSRVKLPRRDFIAAEDFRGQIFSGQRREPHRTDFVSKYRGNDELNHSHSQ